MMKNYDESVEINYKLNWPYIYDHPYSIWIIHGSIVITQSMAQNYFYVKDPFHSNRYITCLSAQEEK